MDISSSAGPVTGGAAALCPENIDPNFWKNIASFIIPI
jgi:hypothetical protein